MRSLFYLLSSCQTVCCGSFHQRELTWAREDLPICNRALVMQWVKGIKCLLGIRQVNTTCVRARIWALAVSFSLACRRAQLEPPSPLLVQSIWQNWFNPVTYFNRSHTTHLPSGIPGELTPGDSSLDRLLQLGSCGTLLASLHISFIASSASWLKSSSPDPLSNYKAYKKNLYLSSEKGWKAGQVWCIFTK